MSIANELRKKGVTPTVQRVATLEQLRKHTDHPTAEEIYKELKEKFPAISPATVYNSLELLRKAGEIQQLLVTKEVARYDPNPRPHHHFLCWSCGRLLNIEVSCPIAESGWIEGNKIGEVQACFYGTCSDCLRQDAAQESKRR